MSKTHVFQKTNIGGVARLEREDLVDQVDAYIHEHCGSGQATQITVTVGLELKGEEAGDA